MILFITGYDRAIIQLRWYLGERPQYNMFFKRSFLTWQDYIDILVFLQRENPC